MMATKKEIWKKESDDLKFIGYLPTEDIVSASEYLAKISDIIDKIGAKADTFGVGGTGLTFNNRFIEIDTDVMATKEWVKSQGYSSDSIVNQQIEDLQHEVTTNSANIATNKASIESLTNDVANRYTKGETDGRYAFKNDIQDTIRQASYSPENLYDINPFLFNNFANLIERGGSAEVYNSEGNRIKSSNEMISLFRFGSGTFTPIYINATTNRVFVFDIIIKSPESYNYAGVLSVYFPSYYDGLILKANAYWGYSSDGTPTTWNSFYNKTGETTLSHHGMYSWIQKNDVDTRNWFKIHFEINQASQEVRLGLISYVPYDGAMSYFLTRNGGTIYDKIRGRITNADTATLANSLSMPRDTSYNPDDFSYSVPGDEKVVAKETSQGSSIGGLGYDWWHIFNNQSNDGGFSTQLALMMCDVNGKKQTPYLAFRNHSWEGWNDWAIAISDKTIADQTVKSFTATEVDHGCKFNGDLQSTSLTYSPKMSQHGKLQFNATNSPDATKTPKTRTVRFGTTEKSVTAPMNAFMEYFFDHGYHFDNGNEGGTDIYDVGIVAYSNRIYYCVFQLNGDGTTDFTASPLETLDETGNSKFLLKKDGTAEGLVLNDNQLGTTEGTLILPKKGGTVVTRGDFYDGLNSELTSKALTANQGKVLNDKITSLSSSISSIKFTTWGTRVSVGGLGESNSRNEPMISPGRAISGGTYGTFYTIWGYENGYNSDYGILAVLKSATIGNKTSTTGTEIVTLVSGETGYWRPQWLSVSVFVPAGATYWIAGARMTNVRYSYVKFRE